MWSGAVAVMAIASGCAGGSSFHRTPVGPLRATMPAADEITLSRPLFARAERQACGRTQTAAPRIRFAGPRRWTLLIRCGGAAEDPVAVHVRFVDVHVPNMLGPTEPEMQGVTNMLGLRLRVIRRRIRGDGETRVIAQRPRPGTVVGFGTTVTIVVGQPSRS
jgi:hypothetical protein